MDVDDSNILGAQATDGRQAFAGDAVRRSNAEPAIQRGTLVTEAVYRLKNPNQVISVDPPDTSSTGNGTGNADANANRRPSAGAQGFSGRMLAKYSETGKNQGESEDETLLRLSNEFQPVVEADWDTVIYIGPPPQEHQQDDHEYRYISQHFSKPYLMNSQTLKDAGSAQFTKFLGPMSARAERKLKKLGVHHLIPQDRKPKYYIDLRPMQDEDEALLMITELTCTPGILSWHASHLASGIPKTLICGRDDLNVTSKPHARSWIEVNDNMDGSEDGDVEVKDFSSDTLGATILDLEPEYSAVRHYMAIERLLHALAGFDPKLNSAPKVWTYFAIAKFFDCATNAKINNWIYSWLFSSNNSNFVQANPESAYRMAMGMRSVDMMRTAFAMLVGERALMQAGRNASDVTTLRTNTSQVSTHGRAATHLDDDEINRIDHAAHSLTRRMGAIFEDIANGPLNWTSGRSELAKFDFIWDSFPNNEIVNGPFQVLQDYVRGEIYQALSQNVEEGDLMRLYRTKAHGDFGWLKRSRSFADAYNAMPLPQRLLTQSFWSQLENYGLYQESEKTIAWSHGHSLDGLNELAPDFEGELTCIPKLRLVNMIEDLNHKLRNDKTWMSAASHVWANHPQPPIGGERVTGYDGAPCRDSEIARAMQGLGMVREAGNFTYYHEHLPKDQRTPESLREARSSVMTIRLPCLLAELSMEMRKKIMREVLTPGYVDKEMGIESEISISQMDILLCLNEEEWKYLPLWAGGFDDGSGGVFAEGDVPDMEAVEGFRGGKRGLGDVPDGVGSVGGSFSMAGDSDDFDQVMTDEGVSTVGKASRIATDGTTSAGASTVMSLDE